MHEDYDYDYYDGSAAFETERQAWREEIAKGYIPEGELDFLSVAALDAELEALSNDALLMLARSAILCLAAFEERAKAEREAGYEEGLESARDRIDSMIGRRNCTLDQEQCLKELRAELE
jgi:hypothetical protein